MNDAEKLARALGPEALALMLEILRESDPFDVHVLGGPLRGRVRSVQVVRTRKQEARGEGEAISLDSAAR